MLRGWIKNLESQGSFSLPLLGDSNSTKVTVAKELEFMREGSKKSVMVKYVGNTNSSPLWDKIRSSYINSQAKLRSLALKFQWQCEQFLYKTCNILIDHSNHRKPLEIVLICNQLSILCINLYLKKEKEDSFVLKKNWAKVEFFISILFKHTTPC